MDHNKKVALLKWLDALSVRSITTFEDLRDVVVVTDILYTCGDLLPESRGLDTLEQRLHALRTYLEGCYHQSFEGCSLINFELLASNVRGDLFEFEMGKLLLALLGCVVQDKAREKFIEPALTMDSQSQYELKEMIECLLFVSDTDTRIPDGFAEVLKRKTESSSHRDAALFFKLVADGGTVSPQRTHGTPVPSASCSVNEPKFAMYSSSPQAGNTSGINIRDISSPLRVMSISSPVTPLGALMYSPQLAQKALLRTKIQEYKRLDLEHQNEKHLRQELEYDLEQYGKTMLEKDNKIRDLERQLGDVRKMRDSVDELEVLRSEREQLDNHVRDLKTRLNEHIDMREQNQMLELELSNMMKEQTAARDELKMMDLLKQSSEKYRVQSHKQQLKITELEASLEHRSRETEQLHAQLEESHNMRHACLEKYNTVKREKEELEEMFSDNQGGMSAGVPMFTGESMNVVTEKRLSELQTEYEQMRSSWIDPLQHNTVLKQLQQEQHTKSTYEDQFKVTKTQLMTCESDKEKLNMSNRQFQCRIDAVELDLADSGEKCRDLEAQIGTLQNREENLQAMVRDVKQQFSKLQTELMLTQQELDDEKRVSEDRRETIAQLDEVKTQSMNTEQQLKQSEQSLKQMVSILEITVDKMKLEKILNSDEIKALKERAANLNEEIAELTNNLENQRSISANVVKKFSSDLAEERAINEQIQSNLKKLTFEYSEYKSNMETKVEDITGTLNEVSKEKNAVDLDLRRLQLELDNIKETSQAKYDRLDRLTEQENQLKQEIHDLKRKNKEVERSEQSLKQVVSILEVSVDKMKCETILNNDEIKALRERAASLNEEIAELTNKLENERSISANIVKKLNCDLTEEHANNEQIQSNLKKLTIEYSEYKSNMESKVEEITGTLSEMSKEKNTLDLDIRRLRLELNNKTESSQVKYDRIDRQLMEQENQFKQEMHDLKRKNEEVERKRQNVKDDLQMSSNVIKEQKEEIQKYNKTIDELKSQVACATGEAETANRMALEYELQIKFLNEQVTVDQEQSACSIKSLQDWYDTLLGQYKEEKRVLDKQIVEMKCQINRLKEDLDSKLNHYSKDKAGLNKNIDDMKSEHESHLFEVNQQHEHSIDKLESNITKLKNITDEMRNSHSNEISKLKKAINCMESERVKLELFNTERISSMSTQLDYLKGVEKCLNCAYSNLETDYDSMKNMIKQREEVREKLETVIGEKDAEVIELRDQVVQFKDQLNAQVGDAERKVKTLNDEKDEAESHCAKYKTHCESEVAELKDRLVEVESYWRSQCEQLEEEYTGIQELRAAHEKQVEEMEKMSEDKDLYSSSQMEAYQLKTQSLEKVLHDREVDIESVTSSLLKVSNEMKNIQSELDNRNEELQKMREELEKQQVDYQQIMCDMKDKGVTLMEEKEVELKLLKESHVEYVERMEKVCSDKDLYVGSQKKDYEDKMDALEKELHDTTFKIEGVNLALLNESNEKQHVQSELINLKEQFEKLQEDMSVEIKLHREAHEKEIEHVEKVSSEKDLYIGSQKLEWEQKMHTLERENSDYERKVSELQSEMNEQGVNHQQIVSEIDEKQKTLMEEKEVDLKLLKEVHKKYMDKMEKTSSDKDIYLCNQKEDYKEKTDALEKALLDKAVENESINLALLNESNEKHHVQSELNNLNKQLEKLQEEMSVELKLQREAHEIHVAQMEKVSEEKDLYIGNEKLAWEQEMNTLKNSNSDYERKMSSELDDRSERLQKLMEEMKEEQLNYQQIVRDMEEKLVKLREEKEMDIKLLKEAHTKYVNEMEKIGADKDLYIGNQKEDYEQKMNMIEKANGYFEKKVSQLQSEMKEQGMNYQQMLCDMEEKLGGEVSVLKERLSQMKCQYETLIESKEKDMKKTTEEWQAQLNAITREKNLTEQQCAAEREQNNKVQSELMILSSKVTVYEKMLSESDSIQTELNQKLESRAVNMNKLDEELSSCQQCVKSMEFELTRCQDELSGFRESMSHEKGEREELCRQLEYTQERNDTLTGELSSQQQQLAAVEEEKRQLDIQINKLVVTQEDTRIQLREQVDTEKCMMELEKAELERQLQSSQKCYEAVNKSKMELQHEAEKMRAEIEQLQEKNRGLEQRLLAFLEQERNLNEENQRQRDRSTELNNNLQAHIRQCDALQDSNTKVKQEFDQVTRKLREEKAAHEIEAATHSEVEEKLKSTETERAHLQEINGKYNIHYNMKKDIISKQAEQMDEMNKQLDYYKRVEDKLTKEVTPLTDKLSIEVAKNKQLFKQIQSLETQNDFADRKLREYKLQLEKASSVFLGDSSDFNRMLASRENCEDASFMENHPSSVPQNVSLFDLENDDTLTPGTRNSLSRRRIGKSVSSSTVSSAQSADTVSIGSASSLAYRLRSRESAVSLNRSISSFDSARSNIPKGTGGIFHCEDEPMQLEWGRLGELSRRNTMCPSHLKTSYPVETQRYNPIRFQEDALRASTIDNQTVINCDQQPGSGRKRKQGWDSNDSGSDSADSKTSKQAKTGCVYQKPGPPTPGTSRRSSKGSRSPRKGSDSRSPRSPITRSRRTPRRTPKANTPKRGAIMDSRSLNGSGKKSTKRDSVAFNVGFSPLSMGRSNRLTRQQAFIQKQPPSVSQTQLPVRKPLGTRNCLQTGV